MPTYEYHLVDVFTDSAFGGNQLAVFTNGASVPPELMPRLAKELNLSETTFVLPPNNPANNFRLRIFTPDKELPTAGHPTVGTNYVLAHLGMLRREGNPTRVVCEELVGDIPVTISYDEDSDDPAMIWMTQHRPQFGPIIEDRTLVRQALSLPEEAIDSRYPVQVVSTGVPFLYVPLNTLADAKRINLNAQACRQLLAPYDADGIFVFTQEMENRRLDRPQPNVRPRPRHHRGPRDRHRERPARRISGPLRHRPIARHAHSQRAGPGDRPPKLHPHRGSGRWRRIRRGASGRPVSLHGPGPVRPMSVTWPQSLQYVCKVPAV